MNLLKLSAAWHQSVYNWLVNWWDTITKQFHHWWDLTEVNYTINGKTFTGLNFRGFHPMEFSQENFCSALRLKYSNNAIIRSLNKYSWWNFQGTLVKHENHESLAQRMFAGIWCISSWEQTVSTETIIILSLTFLILYQTNHKIDLTSWSLSQSTKHTQFNPPYSLIWTVWLTCYLAW